MCNVIWIDDDPDESGSVCDKVESSGLSFKWLLPHDVLHTQGLNDGADLELNDSVMTSDFLLVDYKLWIKPANTPQFGQDSDHLETECRTQYAHSGASLSADMRRHLNRAKRATPIFLVSSAIDDGHSSPVDGKPYEYIGSRNLIWQDDWLATEVRAYQEFPAIGSESRTISEQGLTQLIDSLRVPDSVDFEDLSPGIQFDSEDSALGEEDALPDKLVVIRWVRNHLLMKPGPLLSTLQLATYLGVALEQFEQCNIASFFEGARYTGPFANEERWWKAEVFEQYAQWCDKAEEPIVEPRQHTAEFLHIEQPRPPVCANCGDCGATLVVRDSDTGDLVPAHARCSESTRDVPLPGFDQQRRTTA